jgi:HK97 family phage prohead protease
MKYEKEIRAFTADIEIRFDSDKQPIIEGYAAIFDSLSEDLGGFREKIAPGAFSGSLKQDTFLFWNHDPSIVLGRKQAGTLKLVEDKRGLRVEAKPPEWAKSYIETLQRGDVTGMSFGFIAAADEWDHKKNIRTLTEIAELPEVSIVPFPAYSATDVSVALRSKDSASNTPLIEISGDILSNDHYLARLAAEIGKVVERSEVKLLKSTGEAEPMLAKPDEIVPEPTLWDDRINRVIAKTEKEVE